MDVKLLECLEKIRFAFNSSPNVRRSKTYPKSIENTKSISQKEKSIDNKYTGFYGLWSPRSKKFVFGIQEETRAGVGVKAKKKLGKNWVFKFDVRKIRCRNALDFNDGLRRK